MDDDEDYSIRFRAHELWEQNGEPNGTFLDFWFAAEAELKSNRADMSAGFATTSPADEAEHSPLEAAHALH